MASIKSQAAAIAAKLPKPYTGTDPTANTPASTDEGARRAAELRDRVTVDHALMPGAYDRIRKGGTSQ